MFDSCRSSVDLKQVLLFSENPNEDPIIEINKLSLTLSKNGTSLRLIQGLFFSGKGRRFPERKTKREIRVFLSQNNPETV